MKAALMREYHRPLELVDRPVPEPALHTDVLVRVGAAGVCATDLHAIDGLMEPAGVTLPLVLGHENAGWVEAVGDGVTTVRPGDAVLVYPPYSCGLCVPCRRGNDMHCVRHQFTGLSVDGGFADFVLATLNDDRSWGHDGAMTFARTDGDAPIAVVGYGETKVELRGGTVTNADDPFANVGRNDKCPCGSGRKYKLCHGKAGGAGPTGQAVRGG